MLNLVVGLLLGGCITAVILCCIQVGRIGRCEQEIRRLKEFIRHSEKQNNRD